MSAELHRSARCWGLWADGILACFAALLHRPHPKVHDIMGVSRVVTLPDWQGLGLAFCLVDKIAAAYKTRGKRVHHYPAHPSFIRAMDRSPSWALIRAPGRIDKRHGTPGKVFGGRPCAMFEYVGQIASPDDAGALLANA